MDGIGAAGGGQVGLGEFDDGGVEADLESFGFAGPAFAFGFGDAGQEVVADLLEAWPPGGALSRVSRIAAGAAELPEDLRDPMVIREKLAL